MANCKRCCRSSWLVRLNESGLCGECNLKVVASVQNHFRRLQQAIHGLAASRELDKKITHAERILQEAAELLEFENKGLQTIHPSPMAVISHFSEQWNELLALQSGERMAGSVSSDSSIPSISLDPAMDVLGRFSAPPNLAKVSVSSPAASSPEVVLQ